MRTIKFRGRSKKTGEWVCGDYHRRAGNVHTIIAMEPDEDGKVCYALNQVIPDTVGQFTGLHDKNGTEIYEGDIVRTLSGFVGYVRYNQRFVRYEIAARNEPIENERVPDGVPHESWEIIGNIHDNPELMK